MLNGIYLPGGSIHMVNKTTKEQHPYYLKAKAIIKYSMKMKDEKGEDWPIMGFC